MGMFIINHGSFFFPVNHSTKSIKILESRTSGKTKRCNSTFYCKRVSRIAAKRRHAPDAVCEKLLVFTPQPPTLSTQNTTILQNGTAAVGSPRCTTQKLPRI